MGPLRGLRSASIDVPKARLMRRWLQLSLSHYLSGMNFWAVWPVVGRCFFNRYRHAIGRFQYCFCIGIEPPAVLPRRADEGRHHAFRVRLTTMTAGACCRCVNPSAGRFYTMCGRPLGFKGFAWRLAAGRKRSCVRPVGAATWPLAQMGSASKRQTTARPRGATGINGVSCLSVRPSFISSCPYTPGTGTRLRRRSADADTPRRAPSSPTRCGRSCWPTPRRPACVACGRTTPAARRTTCLA